MVASPCWPSLTLGWVSFWTAVSPVSVGCKGGLDCPSWFVHLFMSLLSFTFSGVRVDWSQLCDPSCGSWVLNSSGARLRRPDALASGRTLSFYRRGFFLGRLLGLGLVGSDPASVPTFFWRYSPSLFLVFAGRFLPFGGPGSCYYPLVPYPHTYIALYFSYAKVTCNTHKNKKLLSIPLKLVPSLAKLPLPYFPPSTGRSASSHPN